MKRKGTVLFFKVDGPDSNNVSNMKRKGTVLFFKVDGSDSNDTVTYSYDNIAKTLSKNTI